MKRLLFIPIAFAIAVAASGQALRTFNSTNDLVDASHNPMSQNTNSWVISTNDMSYQLWTWWQGDTSAVGTYNLQSLRPGVTGRYKLVENLHWNHIPDVNGDTFVIINNTNQSGLIGALTVPYIPYASGTNKLRDSHLYWLANGTGTDTNLYFGTGTTNVLYRSGSNMAYTNGAAEMSFSAVNGSGNALSIGTDLGGVPTVASSTATLYLQQTGGSSRMVLNNGNFGPVSPDVLDSGLLSVPWADVRSDIFEVIGYHGPTGSDYSRLIISQANTNSPMIFNLTSAGTGINGANAGFKFQTNGVEVLTLSPSAMTYINGGKTNGINIINGDATMLRLGFLDNGSAPRLTTPAAAIWLGAPVVFEGNILPDQDNTRGIGTAASTGAWADFFQKGSHYLESFNDGLGTNVVWLRSFMSNKTAIINFVSQTNGVNGEISGVSVRTNGVEVFNVTGTGGPSTAANWTAVGTTDSSLAGTATAGHVISDVVNAVNVKSPPFNAAGNGLTDDTAAIQSAIDCVKTNGGGRLFFPTGTYKITTGLDFSGSMGVSVSGASSKGSVIQYMPASGGARTAADFSGANDCTIENIALYASDISNYPKTILLFGRSSAGAAGNHCVRNCNVRGSASVAVVANIASELNTFSHCQFTLENGTATNVLFVSETDDYSLGSLTSGTMLNMAITDETWLWHSATNNGATCLNINAGTSTGNIAVRDAYLVDGPGVAIYLKSPTSSFSAGPFVFDHIRFEPVVGHGPTNLFYFAGSSAIVNAVTIRSCDSSGYAGFGTWIYSEDTVDLRRAVIEGNTETAPGSIWDTDVSIIHYSLSNFTVRNAATGCHLVLGYPASTTGTLGGNSAGNLFLDNFQYPAQLANLPAITHYEGGWNTWTFGTMTAPGGVTNLTVTVNGQHYQILATPIP